jgi:hypothetical protein
LAILGKEGALLGPGWGLGKGSGAIEAAIAANKRPEGFWGCDLCGVLSVLEHIWTVEDINKA